MDSQNRLSSPMAEGYYYYSQNIIDALSINYQGSKI